MADTTPAQSTPAKTMETTVTTGTLFRRVNNQLVPAPGTAKTAKLKADPTQEYVASGPYYLAATYLRSLAFAIDDITADFGADLYDRMMLDGQVASDVNTIKMGILAQGIQIRSSVKRWLNDEATGKRSENPDWKQAQAITDFCARNFDGTQQPFTPDTTSTLYWSIYNLLDALPYGNKVAEKVYHNQTDSATGLTRTFLRALKVKPRKSVAFVVDPYLNLLGCLALVPGSAMPVLTQALVGDPAQIPNLLPRSKFAILTFRPKDGDPRGVSILRPAYDPWFVKQQIKIERLAYIARFTGGNVVGYTAPDAQEQDALDEDGNTIPDVNGLPTRIHPEAAMLGQLINWRNGSVAVCPNGAKVEVHYPEAVSPFETALDRQDREISQAISGQTRATHEAQFGSRADSETAQDVLGLVVRHGKAAVETMLREDILYDLVLANFGPGALHLTPLVSLSDTEQQDFEGNATAVAALQSAAYFAPSQLPDVDAKLGLPIRTEAEAQPTAPADPLNPGATPAANPGKPAAPGAVGRPERQLAASAKPNTPAQKFLAVMKKLMGAGNKPAPVNPSNEDN